MMHKSVRKIFQIYFLLITVITLYFVVLWWQYLSGTIIFLIISSILTAHGAAVCVLLKAPTNFIRPMVSTYTVGITLLYSPLLSILWKMNDLALYFWIFVTLATVAVIYPRRRAVRLWFFLLGIIVLSFFMYDIISYLFNIDYYNQENSDFLDLPKMLFVPDSDVFSQMLKTRRLSHLSVILAAFLMMSYFLYHKDVLREFMQDEDVAEDKNIENSETIADNDIIPDTADSDTNNEMYIPIEKINALYVEICEYFDRKKPYIDPDYTVAQLAIALNTNTRYVSEVIKHQKNMNFTTFLNIYRIENVKKILTVSNKIKLKHIATSSGFKNQSTFNKVFKIFEGITPTEYCQKLNLDVLDDGTD